MMRVATNRWTAYGCSPLDKVGSRVIAIVSIIVVAGSGLSCRPLTTAVDLCGQMTLRAA